LYKTNESLVFKKLNIDDRKKIEEEIRRTVSPDDVIANIFSFLSVNEIPLDNKLLHTAIWNLKKKYPDYFKEFIFSEVDYYPFSSLFERILFRLQNSNLINTINPGFKRCIIEEGSKKYIRENISPLFGKKNDEIKKIAEDFEKMVVSK
jgi:hypothetical protein